MSRRSQFHAAALRLALLGAGVVCGRAEAADSCGLSVTGLNFGVYDPTSTSPATSTGTILVSCTWSAPAPTRIPVSLLLGAGSSGSYAARTLTSGGSSLQYNLYLDAGGNSIWGSGSGGYSAGSSTIPSGTPSGSASVSLTIYGRIAARQDVAPGAYADTIIVTLNY